MSTQENPIEAYNIARALLAQGRAEDASDRLARAMGVQPTDHIRAHIGPLLAEDTAANDAAIYLIGYNILRGPYAREN